jgi:Uri superfamily endonuclease
MYHKIYDFCKVRNIGNIYKNEDVPTPRVQFILDLLDSEVIKYELDKFKIESGWYNKNGVGYNIILRGTSNRVVVAHHDVSNPHIDNANDNSCSVINAIMIKKLVPEINVVLLDGEECGGLGSERLSQQINKGEFGDIEWILNLELTGRGGKYFFIGDYPGKLTNHIKSIFDCPVTTTPYNDSVTFRKNGIDSVVINPLPPLESGTSQVKWNENTYLDYSMLFNCHTDKDTIDTISVDDMKEFVEEIVLKIVCSI